MKAVRVRVVAAAVGAGVAGSLLSSCAVAPESEKLSNDTYSVAHEAGATTDVPVHPQRIVVLDEYAALNMLDVGVVPDVVFGGLSSEVGAVVLKEEGVNLIAAPTMILEPDFEAVAAQEPDLIVLTDPGESIAESFPSFSEIAPTIVLPYEKPWQEMLQVVGETFHREAEAEVTRAALQQRLDDVLAIPGTRGSMAVLAAFQDFYYSPVITNPLSVTLQQAGFTRPPVEGEAEASGFSTSTVPWSPEELPEHEADAVVVLSGSVYNAEAVQALPTFNSLTAVREGRAYVANGELWSGNFALGTWWLLDDLEMILAGETGLGTIDDAVDRWRALRAAIG
ncbi:ABC transporter substrate-binding protein [Microbacterium saperdae]|uniref:Iron complex transport system substrate-binding protein n=1 Tax=Microbacterium saperdae TaxID=69368 RepID=A0A543BL29_9MICO|nr:ABC transporter substrate-binding protein [Microbacterium saperdae]TQL85526.1 iron complex transport system substrate-binding protein [Microbacterium saperdae]GGM63134.1 iron ABC transporter permease [Microbacterium saperdae]